MTTKEAQQLIGLVGMLKYPEQQLYLEIEILDHKKSYFWRMNKVLVKPVSGKGRAWVNLWNIEIPKTKGKVSND